MPKRRKRKEKERKILVEETLTTSDDLERSFVIARAKLVRILKKK